MKNLLSLGIIWSMTTLAIAQTQIRSAEGGASGVGGGGDASEARVNEIRSDILEWINQGGFQKLHLPAGMRGEDYKIEMKNILAPKFVVLGFVENDDSQDSEQRVQVDGTPKTCRGFISEKDSRPHILCNIGRFEKTAEPAQYRLIHHEYAGLAGIERNDGAASDYEISNQLTDYLVPETVYRLSLKKSCRVSKISLINKARYGGSIKRLREILTVKGYDISDIDFQNADIQIFEHKWDEAYDWNWLGQGITYSAVKGSALGLHIKITGAHRTYTTGADLCQLQTVEASNMGLIDKFKLWKSEKSCDRHNKKVREENKKEANDRGIPYLTTEFAIRINNKNHSNIHVENHLEKLAGENFEQLMNKLEACN